MIQTPFSKWPILAQKDSIDSFQPFCDDCGSTASLVQPTKLDVWGELLYCFFIPFRTSVRILEAILQGSELGDPELCLPSAVTSNQHVVILASKRTRFQAGIGFVFRAYVESRCWVSTITYFHSQSSACDPLTWALALAWGDPGSAFVSKKTPNATSQYYSLLSTPKWRNHNRK